MSSLSVPEILLAEAAAVLRELGWDDPTSEEDVRLAGVYHSDQGAFLFSAEIYPDQPLLVVYAIAPNLVPKPQIPVVSEFLHRANDGLPRACFEIDVELGLVRCRTSLDVEGVDIDLLQRDGLLRPLVRRVVLAALATFELFFPGLNDVVAGRATPAEADDAILLE